MLEVRHTWSLGESTGVAENVLRLDGHTREHTVYLETAAGSTASVELVSARNSTGPFAVLGSSQTLSSGALVILGFTGPYLYVAPRLIAIDSTSNRVTVTWVGN